MSLKSWLDEYAPIPAHRCKKEDSLEASVLKWEGLRSDNLLKHGIERYEGSIVEEGVDDWHTGECALCEFYASEPNGCPECPITKATGQSCTGLNPDSGVKSTNSAWKMWSEQGNPTPMIELLKDVVEWEKEQ